MVDKRTIIRIKIKPSMPKGGLVDVWDEDGKLLILKIEDERCKSSMMGIE